SLLPAENPRGPWCWQLRATGCHGGSSCCIRPLATCPFSVPSMTGNRSNLLASHPFFQKAATEKGTSVQLVDPISVRCQSRVRAGPRKRFEWFSGCRVTCEEDRSDDWRNGGDN